MSSGPSGGIKGGMAYVQAYLDDNPVTQGLAKLRGKIRSWQSSLGSMAAGTMGGQLPEPLAAIVRFAQSPAGAFTALLGAAKFTAEAREQMLLMAESTGVSVEKLSQYAYAARRAGISNEALANGLKRLESKEFLAAMQGMSGKGGGMKAMTSATFARLGSGDATDKLREFIHLTETMPTAEKIGLAKRLGLSELLPLISQGVDSLDAFTARAKELGLVMNEDDAKAGKRFEQAFGDLTDVLKSSAGAIGGALVPMITGMTNAVVRVAAGVRNWIKEHQALAQGIFLVTGAIVAGGIAIKLLSIGFGILASAIGIVSGIFTVASGVVSVFNFILAITDTLLGGLALPILAVVAVLGGLVAYIVYSSGILGDFGRMLGQMGADAGEAMGSIAHAIAGGDIEKAWKVVTAFLQYEWANVLYQLGAMWDGFVESIKSNLSYISPALAMYLNSGGSGTSDKQVNEALDNLERLRKEMNDAKSAANAVKVPELGGGGKSPTGFDAMQQNAVAGTFSGIAAGMLGGGGIAQQQLQVAEDDYALSQKWRDEANQHAADLNRAFEALMNFNVVQ